MGKRKICAWIADAIKLSARDDACACTSPARKMDGGVASSSDVPPDTDTDSFDAFNVVQKNRNSCIHWILQLARRIERDWTDDALRPSASSCSPAASRAAKRTRTPIAASSVRLLHACCAASTLTSATFST